MATLPARWTAFIDRQHRTPNGIVGRLIGERMLRQHTPETDWSVQLLDIQSTDRVLEIGFGAGRGLALALQRASAGHVAGVDVSPTMIAAAALRNRTALQRGQLALLRGDIADLPFGTERFDKIFSIHTFYFWADQKLVCEQIASMLAPGGRLVVTFATAKTLPSGERVYWELHQQAESLAETLDQQPGIVVRLATGPDSRQFNNVALVLDRT